MASSGSAGGLLDALLGRLRGLLDCLEAIFGRLGAISGRLGLHPKYDWAVSCGSREAPMSRSEAEAYDRASKPQQTTASAAPLDCLAALRARVAEKEARRQAT